MNHDFLFAFLLGAGSAASFIAVVIGALLWWDSRHPGTFGFYG
jgi:hypothetical protein